MKCNNPKPTFIPLVRNQGLSKDEVLALFASKKVIIWGAGHLGKVLLRLLRLFSLNDFAFCDVNPLMHGLDVSSVQVISTESALKLAKNGEAAIVIASMHHMHAISERCSEFGLIKGQQFITYIDLPRRETLVDICDSPASFNHFSDDYREMRGTGVMSLATYQRVLDKLLQDFPYLLQVGLNNWGEPFLNPELERIIRYTQSKVPCCLETSLQDSSSLKGVILAQPSQFTVVVSGTEANYEVNQAGDSWRILLENLRYLSALRLKYPEQTEETEFRVLYVEYANHDPEQFKSFSSLCDQLSLRLIKSTGYINPYDRLLDECNRSPCFPPHMDSSLLSWDMSEALRYAMHDQYKPCLCQRIFPVVNADASVATCHLYSEAKVSNDILTCLHSDLLDKRAEMDICRLCQRNGLHRLDIDIIKRRHPHKEFSNNNN